MMMEKSREADPAEFEAVTVKEYAPVAAGMPEIEPEESIESPSGSVPSERDHVMGDEPMAENAAE